MLKPLILFSVCALSWASNNPNSSSIVAKVNGEVIYEEDLAPESTPLTRDEKIQRAIQYRLIIQEAKKLGLERSPDIQTELNKLLYKKFIEHERKNQKKQFTPTEKELHQFYEKFPLIRIHHLVLNRRTEAERQVADLTMSQIGKELKNGTPFEQLCTRYSQDASALFGGDNDFRGPHNFPEEFYLKIRGLPKNTVSDPIEIGSTVHYFEWFEKKPFTTAPASYLQYLQSRFEESKEKTLLTELLKSLELKATIETSSVSRKDK
ncbi:MAG: peptidylprolyl isomerase [Deltaproteobacteria bacterium]